MTPQELQRLKELRAKYGVTQQPASAQPEPSMGMGERIGRQLLNLPGRAIGATADTLTSIPRSLLSAIGVESANPEQTDYSVMDVPSPQTTGEVATDVVLGGVFPEIPAFIVPSIGAARGLRLLGAGTRAAAIGGDVIAGVASGLRTSPEEAALQAGEFGLGSAAFQALGSRSPVGRALLGGVANAAIGTGGQLLRGNDITTPEALTQIAVMGGVPIAQEAIGAAGRRLLRRAVSEVPSAPDAPTQADPEAAFAATGGTADDYARMLAATREPVRPPIADDALTAAPEPLIDDDVFAGVRLAPDSILNPAQPTRQPLRRVSTIDADEGLRSAMTPDAQADIVRESRLLRGFPAPRELSEPSVPIRQFSDPEDLLVRKGSGLRPLSRQSGQINPNVLGGLAGATVGGLMPADDGQDRVQQALVGAAIGIGGAQGARLLRSAKLREATDLRARGERSAIGNVGRFFEKNLNWGKSERLKAIDDQARGTADKYATRMREATEKAGRMALGQGLPPAHIAAGEAFIDSTGGPNDISALRRSGAPDEYVQYLLTAKEAQKDMQRVLMAAESDPKKQNLIASTLGNYQTRQFRYFLQPDTFQINPAEKAAVINEWKNNPIFAGVDPADLDNAVTRDLDQHLMELRDAGGDYTKVEGKSKISQALYTKRKDLTPAYRTMLGEVTDKHEAQILTASKLVNSVAQAKVVGDLRNATDERGYRFAMPMSEYHAQLESARTSGDKAKYDFLLNRYTQAPDSPGIGALAGQMVQRQVADFFQFAGHKGLDTGDGSWYALVNQIPKFAFTRGNIGSWVRNYAQMIPQGHALGIFNPMRILKTAARLSKDKDLRDELLGAGVLGAHAGVHEFGKQAKLLGDALDQGWKGRARKLMEMINDGYGKPDQWLRATAYIDEMEKNIARGLPKQEASLRALEFVNRYSMNYGQVSKLVGKARNLPFVNPFVSYTAEMARIIKNLASDVVQGNDRAVQSGIALVSLLAAPTMIGYAAQEFALDDKQKAELAKMEELLPDYMRGRLNVAIGADAKGNFTTFNAQPWIPAGDFISLARNILNAEGEALAAQNPVMSTAGSPLLSAYIELTTGKDRITGQPTSPVDILRKNVVPMDYRIRQFGQAFTPNEEGGLGITNAAGRETTPTTATLGLLGFGTSTTSKKRLLKRLEYETQQEIQQAKKESEAITKTNAAASVKEKARTEYREKRRRILERRREILQRVQ